jgi:hypothetical protein
MNEIYSVAKVPALAGVVHGVDTSNYSVVGIGVLLDVAECTPVWCAASGAMLMSADWCCQVWLVCKHQLRSPAGTCC